MEYDNRQNDLLIGQLVAKLNLVAEAPAAISTQITKADFENRVIKFCETAQAHG